MTMTSHLPRAALLLAAASACALALPAAAQSIGYGSVSEGASDTASSSSSAKGDRGRDSRGRGRSGKRVDIEPYIEAAQVVTARFTPGSDVLTYTALAAGVDANVAGQYNGASVSLRYERDIGWGKNAEDGDQISGIARGYTTLVPGVQLEAGGLAARSRVDGNGAVLPDTFGDRDAETQIYSVYAGPSVATRAGEVAVDGHYRFGYTRVEAPDALVVAPGAQPADVFDESTVHSAELHAGTAAGTVLPVGIGAGGGWYREDISNLDQRVEDLHARLDVTLPVSRSVALVGGVGYEDVEVSSRDAVLDANGNPVLGPDGRFVTDRGSPRVLAYDVNGLIWDAGVIWRPSRRTSLEAHVGRRYGSTSYYGTFAYAPTVRSSINVSVYDNVAGFGGQLNRALIALPTDFEAVRNPLTGDITGCVASLESGNCVTGSLGSVRSATFRARGVMASYGLNLGRLETGIGAGYDRRKFIAAPGTVLAAANGVIDETWWVQAFLAGRLGQNAGFRANAYANWFDTGTGQGGDTNVIGATGSYYRNLTRRLTATAALGINGINQEDPLQDFWTGSALLGLTYTF